MEGNEKVGMGEWVTWSSQLTVAALGRKTNVLCVNVVGVVVKD
jgi:hypothetical protein